MQTLILFLSLFQTPSFAQQAYSVAAEPEANPQPTPPVQYVNGGILQINNNERMAQPTPAFSPTPAFRPNPVPQQQQQVLPEPQQQQQQVPPVQPMQPAQAVQAMPSGQVIQEVTQPTILVQPYQRQQQQQETRPTYSSVPQYTSQPSYQSAPSYTSRPVYTSRPTYTQEQQQMAIPPTPPPMAAPANLSTGGF